mgnify:CR=1 FL=1
MLLEAGADIEARDTEQYSALECYRTADTYVSVKNPTALMRAAERHDEAIIQFLLANNANVNLADPETGITPLMLAVYNTARYQTVRDPEIARIAIKRKLPTIALLLIAKADVNALSKTEISVLTIAHRQGAEEIEHQLLAFGAKDPTGRCSCSCICM